MTPFAIEGSLAVLGGLIPILGLVFIGWVIVRAARDDGANDE